MEKIKADSILSKVINKDQCCKITKMLRVFIDHDFNHRILRGLTRRIPNLDYVTAEQIGKRNESDKNHLYWALENSRVIISHDVNTFSDAANKKLLNNESIFGLILVHQSMPIGEAIDELEYIISCAEENEFINRVQFLPL